MIRAPRKLTPSGVCHVRDIMLLFVNTSLFTPGRRHKAKQKNKLLQEYIYLLHAGPPHQSQHTINKLNNYLRKGIHWSITRLSRHKPAHTRVLGVLMKTGSSHNEEMWSSGHQRMTGRNGAKLLQSPCRRLVVATTSTIY